MRIHVETGRHHPMPLPAEADRPPATRPITVVTGASEGLGLALARRFASRGHGLLLVARGEEGLAVAAAALRSEHAVAVHTLALDLAESDAPRQLMAALERLGAHCEVLVNNAGIGHCGPFCEADPDLLERIVDVNVQAPMRLMRSLLPGMRRRRSGGVLNVASLGGYVPGPYQAAYYASKACLLSLSEAVAAECRADGVRITVVAPGPINTRFHAKMLAESALYRSVLPARTAAGVAGWSVLAFELGVRVVVPGFLSLLAYPALRFLPHALLIPIMATLLYPRQGRA